MQRSSISDSGSIPPWLQKIHECYFIIIVMNQALIAIREFLNENEQQLFSVPYRKIHDKQN